MKGEEKTEPLTKDRPGVKLSTRYGPHCVTWIDKQKTHRRKAKSGKEDSFQLRDLVLQKNIKARAEERWQTGFGYAGTLYSYEAGGQKRRKINIDQLTCYLQPEERVPAKLKKLFAPCEGPSEPPVSPPSCEGASEPPVSPPSCEGASVVQSCCDPENGK
ncbi:hypothetical protein ACER0C_004757 [Sarotherodon galilaeus]